jgi:hypothetical protein
MSALRKGFQSAGEFFRLSNDVCRLDFPKETSFELTKPASDGAVRTDVSFATMLIAASIELFLV